MTDRPRRPTNTNKKEWAAYWEAEGLSWRTEPEIDAARQRFLSKCRTAQVSIRQGRYPFRGITLTRADIEWLLATHVSGALTGPVSVDDERHQGRIGLDLRGADISGVNLSRLPLARLQAGLSEDDWKNASREQRANAVVHADGVNLRQAHLEYAVLRQAEIRGGRLERARLHHADLFGADLHKASLPGVIMMGANARAINLHQADLYSAFLQGGKFRGANLEQATLNNAHLEDALLSRANLQHASLAYVHLQGARLYGADLTHTNLVGSFLEGARTSEDLAKFVSPWLENFPRLLPPADLRNAFLDTATRLEDVVLGNPTYGCASVADVHWDGVNLGVLNWAAIDMLGDERYARQKRKADNSKKTKEELSKGYRSAVRANRQLAAQLRAQGLNEEADHFAYRAQRLQRIVLRREAKWARALGSWILDLISGYGYKPARSILVYIIVVCLFAAAYLINAQFASPHLTWDESLVLSVSSFHGRGFFSSSINLGDTLARLAAGEAIIGLLIEITFIATFTQRFFAR